MQYDIGNSQPTRWMQSHGSPPFLKSTGSPHTTKGRGKFHPVQAMWCPQTDRRMEMLGESIGGLKVAGTSKSHSCEHVGSTSSCNFNEAKSRASMSFTCSNTPNVSFG